MLSLLITVLIFLLILYVIHLVMVQIGLGPQLRGLIILIVVILFLVYMLRGGVNFA